MVLRNDTSRMMGDYHVRFCERLEGETPSCLLSDPSLVHLKVHEEHKEALRAHDGIFIFLAVTKEYGKKE